MTSRREFLAGASSAVGALGALGATAGTFRRNATPVNVAVSPPPPPPPTTTQAMTVGTNANRQLLASVFPQLNSVPAGNAVTISKTGGPNTQLTLGAVYQSGSAVIGAPSAAYTSGPSAGTEGLGYTSWTEDGTPRTAVPAAETRTTAMPTLDCITIPHEKPTSKFALVFEGNNEDEIAKVRVYVEGAYLDLTTQSWYYYTDVNGIFRSKYGYVCEIDAANYLGVGTDATRGIYVFARAYPVDVTKQTRLINDFTTRSQRLTFYPSTKPFGCRLQVSPSAGANSFPGAAYPGVEAIFTTFQDAVAYSKGQTVSGHTCSAPAQRVMIEITENGVYPMVNLDARGAPGDGYSPLVNTTSLCRGYTRVTHSPGLTNVTFRGSGPAATWNPGMFGMEWAGKAIFFDATFWTGFTTTTSPGSTADRYWWWINGIGGFVCDWDMYDHLDDSGMPRAGAGAGFIYQTDNDNLNWCYLGAALLSSTWIGSIGINNTRKRLSHGDIFSLSQVVYKERVITAGAGPWRTTPSSISVTYAGPGTGSMLKSGNSAVLTGTILFKDSTGTQVGSTYSLNSYAKFTNLVTALQADAALAAEGFTFASLVTTGDRVTDRAPISISGSLSNPTDRSFGFTETLPAGVAVSLTSFFDIHMDNYQSQTTPAAGRNNVIVKNVQGFGYKEIQTMFLDGIIFDSHFENLFFDNNPNGVSAHIAAINNVTCRNIADANTTMNFGGITDTYDVTEGWVFGAFSHSGTLQAQPVLTDQHYVSGYADVNSQHAVNISTGGSSSGTIPANGASITSLYPNIASQDPRPGGELMLSANLIAPHTEFDVFGVQAPPSNLVPKGPVYQNYALNSCTGAQARELAVVVYLADTATVNVSYMDGPGDTGNLVSLQANITGLAA